MAMACSVDASISATPTPGDVVAHGVGGRDDVGDHVGQRTVVADRAAEHERHASLHALVHHAAGRRSRRRPRRRSSRGGGPR